MQTYVYPDAAKQAGKYLSIYLDRYRKDGVLLLLSGGSAFALLPHIDLESVGKHVTTTVLDERFSSLPNVNNFMQLMREPFYTDSVQRRVNFFDTRILEDDTLKSHAQRLEKFLSMWQKIHQNGIVIATLGIGDDGHTAGMMPHPEDTVRFNDLFDGERLVVGYDALDKNEHRLRVTPTNTFLKNQVHHAVAYAVKDHKAPLIKKLLNDDRNYAAFPANVLHDMPDVALFTDQAV